MVYRMRTFLARQTIDMASRRHSVEKGLTIFHSDRGNQYTPQRFLDHLNAYGIRPLVERTGALGQYMCFSRSMSR